MQPAGQHKNPHYQSHDPVGGQPGPYTYGGPPSGPPGPYGPQSGQPGPSGELPQGDQPVGIGEMPFESADQGEASLNPTAPPPIQDMQKIPGYDDILSPNVTNVAPPPSYQEATSGKPVEIAPSAKLSETEARDLLVALAKSKCCWGKGAAEAMRFKNLQQSTAVHYVLKTFLETRSTDWTSVPFEGQMIDGPQNGAAPAPWTIEIPAPPMFQDTISKCEVPHTASVRVCHGCGGATLVICWSCSGWGQTRCSSCHGSGHTGVGENRRSCSFCHGCGRRRCFRCSGRGRVPCPTCRARGQVKCFVQLTVAFKTIVKDFILERTPLPDYLIRNVAGIAMFEDTQPLLNPVQTFPEQEVNIQSANIIQEHRDLTQTGRIWMQNHVIRGVPVFQCDCVWKDKEFQFFVYGVDRKVYCESYPQTCCCGCSLL